MSETIRVLTTQTGAKLDELIGKMGQPKPPVNRSSTPQPLIAVVKCGVLGGTLTDGTPYYECSDIQWFNSDGEFSNLSAATGWLVGSHKGTLVPDQTYFAMAGPQWEGRVVFVAGSQTRVGEVSIVRIPDPATTDDEGLIEDCEIQGFTGLPVANEDIETVLVYRMPST